MKKVIAMVLAVALMLSLGGCGGFSFRDILTPKRQIGGTASGDPFNLTLLSAEYVKRIEKGQVTEFGSGVKTSYKDVVPVDGYSILKLELMVTYHGKKKASLSLPSIMTVEYDNGYEFKPQPWNGKMYPNQGYVNGYYNFNDDRDLTVEVKDPLNYTPQIKSIYIFVNEIVEENLDAPLYLRVELPGKIGKKDHLFDLRTGATAEEIKEEKYKKAVALLEEGACVSWVDALDSWNDALEYLEDIGDYKDSAQLYENLFLRMSVIGFDGSVEKQYLLDRIGEFPVLTGAQIEEQIVGSWRLSRGVNAWDFLADGKIDDKWGNKRTWQVVDDKLVMTQTKYTYYYTVYQVYEGGYLLVDEQDTSINAKLTMFKED